MLVLWLSVLEGFCMLGMAPVSHVCRLSHAWKLRHEESGRNRKSCGREEGRQHEVKAM